jgi:hypothetical protein
MSKLRETLLKARRFLLAPLLEEQRLQTDLLIDARWRSTLAAARNPLNRCGAKYFSQTDEDGITLEILRRMGFGGGVFAEFGVGDGLENNTLVLLASGWRGFWVGNEPLKFRHENRAPRFAYVHGWMDRETVVDAYRAGLRRVDAAAADVVSLDLDGNDLHFTSALLAAGARPSLWIVEYNAKFPPPIRWHVAYDAGHTWAHDDYFGASLASYVELFAQHRYTLVCCNAHSGTNAFFVRDDSLDRFADVPRDPAEIFQSASYYVYAAHGHRPSGRTVERMLDMPEAPRGPDERGVR